MKGVKVFPSEVNTNCSKVNIRVQSHRIIKQPTQKAFFSGSLSQYNGLCDLEVNNTCLIYTRFLPCWQWWRTNKHCQTFSVFKLGSLPWKRASTRSASQFIWPRCLITFDTRVWVKSPYLFLTWAPCKSI